MASKRKLADSASQLELLDAINDLRDALSDLEQRVDQLEEKDDA